MVKKVHNYTEYKETDYKNTVSEVSSLVGKPVSDIGFDNDYLTWVLGSLEKKKRTLKPNIDFRFKYCI